MEGTKEMAQTGSGKIHAVILAAGSSRRFGMGNKLLTELDGRPMLQRVVDAVMAGGVDGTVVVTGADHASITSLLGGYGVKLVRNERWEEGMGTSLAMGVKALDEENCAGILVCLGDLPYLSSRMVGRVIGVFRQNGSERIVVPKVKGRRGHPVIFPGSYRTELGKITGDEGARSLLNRVGDKLTEVEVHSPEIVQDVDRQSDLPDSDIE